MSEEHVITISAEDAVVQRYKQIKDAMHKAQDPLDRQYGIDDDLAGQLVMASFINDLIVEIGGVSADLVGISNTLDGIENHLARIDGGIANIG